MSHENRVDVCRLVNKNVFVVTAEIQPAPTGDRQYQGLNLCHRAAKNNCRDLVHCLLLHCGADLSARYVEIGTEGSEYVIRDRDTVFSLIVMHFREPISFVKGLLDDCIFRSEKSLGDDLEFSFGE